MERHRPSFSKFAFADKNKRFVCKYCGKEIQLSEKQKRIHFTIIPIVYIVFEVLMMSFDFSWNNNITNIRFVNRLIVGLFYILLYVLVLFIQYLVIRFEPVQPEEDK